MASETINTFELFPNLPLELRRKIWLHSLPPRHTFQLNIHHPAAVENRPLIKERFPDQSLMNDPATLRTSRESRTVALEHYNRKPEYYSPWFLFVDYAVDVFEMYTSGTAHATDLTTDLARIENITVFPTGDYQLDIVAWWLIRWLPELPSLKYVTFDVSSLGGAVNTVTAEAVMTDVDASLSSLGVLRRAVGNSRNKSGLLVTLRKNDGFHYESRLRFEDTPGHPLA
jgi:hypothetical protein